MDTFSLILLLVCCTDRRCRESRANAVREQNRPPRPAPTRTSFSRKCDARGSQVFTATLSMPNDRSGMQNPPVSLTLRDDQRSPEVFWLLVVVVHSHVIDELLKVSALVRCQGGLTTNDLYPVTIAKRETVHQLISVRDNSLDIGPRYRRFEIRTVNNRLLCGEGGRNQSTSLRMSPDSDWSTGRGRLMLM
jgi:hypothetical protein